MHAQVRTRGRHPGLRLLGQQSTCRHRLCSPQPFRDAALPRASAGPSVRGVLRIVRPCLHQHPVAIAPSLHAAEFGVSTTVRLGSIPVPPASRMLSDMPGRAKRVLVTTVLTEDHESPATDVIFSRDLFATIALQTGIVRCDTGFHRQR